MKYSFLFWLSMSLVLFSLNTYSQTNPINTFPVSGNVGVGTNKPGYMLTVKSAPLDYSSQTIAHFGRTTGARNGIGDFIGIGPDPTVVSVGGVFRTITGWGMELQTASITRLRIDNKGNVGIGTLSPTTKLEVNGNISFTVSHGTLRTIWNNTYGGAVQLQGNSFTKDRFARIGIVDNFGKWVGGIHITNDCNVGIGTYSPASKLDVAGDLNISSGSTYNINGTPHLHTQYLNKSGADTISLVTGNSTRLTILKNGNVGIGTLSPGYLLQVSGGDSQFDQPTVGTTFARFRFPSSSVQLFMQDNSSVNTVAISSNGNTFFNGGNVGIGTTSPTSKLDVFQTPVADNSNLVIANFVRGGTSTGGSSIIKMGYFATSDFEQNGMYSATGQRYGTYGDLNIVNNGFNAYGGVNIVTQANVRIAILPGGNVGIGTTTPGAYKLNVWGKIRAHEIVVNTSGADFVFAPDYKLLSLKEVEEFINVNKHLPDLQPATEMVENGMNVSEMQTKLLQKIEELTIYAIEQNKRYESQDREIDLLKEEIAILKSRKSEYHQSTEAGRNLLEKH